jgi:hypothetical protein
MNKITKLQIPPNPYKRSPVKRLEDLAGRARERKTIRYYLNLTASGGNPHLALLGQRGVGKTSLLNGAESIARDLRLLPVRVDMNELKAQSPGRFWHDLYQTLALSLVRAGCWGGEQGTIYAELLRMIHSRQPGSLEKAVLQIPYVFSCHQGIIDNFDCPDALVVNDFNTCLTELRSRGILGIALLIDEADCLGKNVPLLQMFRNIFQTVEHCSLVLAGTEAVFPALSEVFSPIPRQFHRIDVKPFARWSDTMELVLGRIPEHLADHIAPKRRDIQELHQLCGGAPDEIQLYCHHMYRSVDEGSSQRMDLSPHVFREVLREYRSNTPANVDAVLNAIERLPDRLLFESKWLSRRTLTLEQNIQVTALRRALVKGRPLSSEERAEIVSELTDGYSSLFAAGITEANNYIRLAGAPLTAGFWKSFVEAEKGKRWSWNDNSFAVNLRNPVATEIGKMCNAFAHIESRFDDDNAKQALFNLRAGRAITDVDAMGEMILTALIARDSKASHVVDVSFQLDSPAGHDSFQTRYIEQPKNEIQRAVIDKWLDANKAILVASEISYVVAGFSRWEVPTSEELHRLGNISGYVIPDALGPNQFKQAISKFNDGDIKGCSGTFAKMLADKEDSEIRNNLAFCQILLGEFVQALENATKAVADNYQPLFELNRGIAEFLQGNGDRAKQSLRNALQETRAPRNKSNETVYYVLVLEPIERKARSYSEISIEAAILINLWRMGDLTRADLTDALTTLSSEKATSLLAAFTGPET